jgi:transposase
MRQITEVLRLKFEAKLSHATIARAVGLSKGTVGKVVSVAKAKGVSWPLPAGLDEAALEALLYRPRRGQAHGYREPDYAQLHTELKRKGVTLQLLWSEYAAEAGEQAYRYSQFCLRYRQWIGRQQRSLRQVHRAGEKLFIDYCGPTVAVIDAESGGARQAQVFVAVLGASSYTYAEATWSQSLPDWIGSHQRALAFFGGVPALLVPDNLRAAVKRPDRYAPELNATYQDLARHYGTAILPARPYKPKDKAKAEVAVQVVERWILARLRHQRFFALAELNAAIHALLEDLNARPFQKLPGSRQTLFEQLDRPALKALPATPFEYAEWRHARVGIDYHIHVDGTDYSVPHRLVGARVDVRLSATSVEVLHRGQRVATHPRQGAGGCSTRPEHMPKAHQAHQQWSPPRLLDWAQTIGPATRAVVAHQLSDPPHPEHGYRACLGLRQLERSFGPGRLEAACARALAIAAPSYHSVRSILTQGLDQQPLPEAADAEAAATLPSHANVRGARYYH